MYLTDIRINAFGSVRDVTLDRLNRGLTGIYGSNGSGKTTVLQFLRGTFGDRSAAFWRHTHVTPSGHVEVQSKGGRAEHSVQGDSGSTVLSGSEARRRSVAQLATVTASEASDTTLVEQLAQTLEVSLDDMTIDLTKEREAHAALVAERTKLIARPAGTIASAENELNRIEQALSAARAEHARTSDRLASQAKALQAQFASTLRNVDQTHGDYQAAQTDLTAWQTDAWRPRRSTIHVEDVEVEVEEAPVTHEGTNLRDALLEIAQLRCKASAKRADAAAGGPLDLCGNSLSAPLRIADEIRESLDRLRNAAGIVPAAGLSARVDDLIDSLSYQQRAVDWLQADRTRILLDRCERDLEQAALTKCAVCAQGSTACETHTCRTETQTRTIEVVEPDADAEVGLGLANDLAQAHEAWQLALGRHRQARRQLEQFDSEVARAAHDNRIARLIVDRDAAAKHLHDLRIQADALTESITALEAILAQDRAPSGPLVDAGSYFQRLTCGHYTGLVRGQSGRSELRAMTAAGQSIALNELSRGTRTQAALAMRLSVLDALTERDLSPPLVLDDILVDSDKERATAGINLLKEWSKDRQTLLMTCQRQLIEAMKSSEITIHTLGSETVSAEPRRVAIVSGTSVKPSPAVVQFAASQAVGDSRNSSSNVNTTSASEKESFWLDPDSMTVRVPSISETDARRLASIGIESVEHLVLVTLSDIEQDLVELQINPRSFLRWQSESRLLCLVPGLTARDAQLLAWAGITTPNELGTLDIEKLRTRLRGLSGNKSASYLKVDTETFSTDRLNRWRSRARKARSSSSLFTSRPKLRSVRDSRRDRRDANHRSTTTARGTESQRPRTLSVVERRRAMRREGQGAMRREGQSQNGQSHESNSGSTASVATAIATAKTKTTTETREANQAAEWRYYLEAESPVVDAPSIGPKMARRLGKQRIKTVSDLLAADAAAVARNLDDRRIKKQTVIDWQDQARLMCCIPMLRGHDVQVLVACGFRTVDKVAASNPNAMFSIVGPFVKSKEGERLLRSSKVPDLEEVTDWINYSRHSRALKAA